MFLLKVTVIKGIFYSQEGDIYTAVIEMIEQDLFQDDETLLIYEGPFAFLLKLHHTPLFLIQTRLQYFVTAFDIMA